MSEGTQIRFQFEFNLRYWPPMAMSYLSDRWPIKQTEFGVFNEIYLRSIRR